MDARTHRAVKTIAARPGPHTLRFEPKGRSAFVTNPKGNLVHVFDASTNALLHNLPVGKEHDRIAFTDAVAYVRSAGTEELSLMRSDR